jgi:hypothetical protein
MNQQNDVSRQLISNRVSFFLKYIFTPLWIIGVGIAAVMRYARSQDDWILLLVWLITAPIVYYMYARIKKVEADAAFLYISDFRHAIQVPHPQVADIIEKKWFNYHPVWIRFKEPTPFGKEIVLIPYNEMMSPKDTPSAATVLRNLAGLSK